MPWGLKAPGSLTSAKIQIFLAGVKGEGRGNQIGGGLDLTFSFFRFNI